MKELFWCQFIFFSVCPFFYLRNWFYDCQYIFLLLFFFINVCHSLSLFVNYFAPMASLSFNLSFDFKTPSFDGVGGLKVPTPLILFVKPIEQVIRLCTALIFFEWWLWSEGTYYEHFSRIYLSICNGHIRPSPPS